MSGSTSGPAWASRTTPPPAWASRTTPPPAWASAPAPADGSEEHYTLLRLTRDGIVLCAYHALRLALDECGMQSLGRFARTAAPGVWAVRAGRDGALRVERRRGSRLKDGMPARSVVSPLMGVGGRIAKPASPSPYDAVRADGIISLLVDAAGTEILEACTAAVLAWDGDRLCCVPSDRPAVWSTAEAAVRDHLPVRETSLALDSDEPLLLVNAVKGTCGVTLAGRRAFPKGVRQEIERLFEQLTCRPLASG